MILGDEVRFLSQEGGGRVTRIEGKMAWVEDADGFDVPVLVKDLVVVPHGEDKRQAAVYERPATNHSTNQVAARDKGEQAPATQPEPPARAGASWRARLHDNDDNDLDAPLAPATKNAAPKATPAPKAQDKSDKKNDPEPATAQVTATEPEYHYETEVGDDSQPQFLVALTQSDQAHPGAIDLHIVNDSNYWVSYTLLRVRNDGQVELVRRDTIEPNTQLRLDTLLPAKLDGVEFRLQGLLHKPGRPFKPQPPIQGAFKPSGVALCKVGAYVPNDYFDQRAMLFPLIPDPIAQNVAHLSAEQLRLAMRGRESFDERDRRRNRKGQVKGEAKPTRPNAEDNNPLVVDKGGHKEVDLHIAQLVDTQAGLTNADMLRLQLDTVRRVMADNAKNNGQRIVFIHGVGAGVLKREMLALLHNDYPKARAQDAPFAEYGFGATLVII